MRKYEPHFEVLSHTCCYSKFRWAWLYLSHAHLVLYKCWVRSVYRVIDRLCCAMYPSFAPTSIDRIEGFCINCIRIYNESISKIQIIKFGAIQVLLNAFFWKFDTHPLITLITCDRRPYICVTLFFQVSNTLPPPDLLRNT